ncbi:MAG: 4Fe-4S dicluster domain-containing protein [Bacteroidales bacterium]|nr:4Fe-4S dicluster domain-containing protein [Bacteroidales bacterium]
MLRPLRTGLALFFFIAITLLFLDASGTFSRWFGWTAKLQFLPSVMAMNVFVIAFLILLTLLAGRIYCSVICPLGVLQDIVSRVRITLFKKRNPFKYVKEHKWLRYAVWVVFLAAYLAGIQVVVALLAPYSAYGRIVRTLVHPAGAVAIIVAALTLLLVGILAWTGGRTYCNSICPVGTTLSFFSRFAMFRPVIDEQNCKNCRICEHNCKAQCIDIANHKIDYSRCVDCFDCIGGCKFDALHYKYAWGAKKSGLSPASEPGSNGRRAFLSGAALGLGALTLNAQKKKVDGGFAAVLDKEIPTHDTPLTPPGSKSVKDFYSRCTACQLCISECPNGVLRPSTDLSRLMQPEMAYEKGYCRPECTRCSQLCPAGAIIPISREEKTEYHIGTAHVNRSLCVAQEGTKCGNCARHCPVGAIQMVENEDLGNTIPAVNEQICIGCGACENLCPVRPISAITVNGRHNHLNI